MADGEKRIVELTETQSFGTDDYLALDNINNTETKKIKAKTVGKTYTIEDTEDGFTFAGDNGYSHNVHIPDVEIEEKTASGEIATFEDGGENIPMKSVVCEINPIQDLHGYDNPWVGGAGKNKINLADIVTPSAGFVYNREPVNIAVNTYTLSFNFTGSSGSISISLRNGETIVSTLQDKSLVNGLNTFTIPTLSNNADSISLYAGVGGTYENFMLEIGTQATAFEPYSNICPISGFTEANVSVSGVNVWDEEWEVGSFDGSGNPVATTVNIRSKNFIPIVPSANYYNYTGDNSWLTRVFYDTNKNYISTQSTKNGTFTTPPNALYMKFRTEGGVYGATYNNDISINYPSTDTEYHAYNGNTYNVEFKDGSNPLIVYGGTLDVVSGVLTVDRASVDLGTVDWNKYTSSTKTYFRTNAQLPDAKKSDNPSTTHNLMCSNYKEDSWSHVIDNSGYDGNICIGWNNNAYIGIYDSRYVDASESDFKTAMNGVQLVYELATPQTYQLTPTQVKSLLGTNNVWHDCNGDISVTYVKGNLGGYVYGLDKQIENVDGKVENIKTEVGTAELQTTDKTIKGAINEIDNEITQLARNEIVSDAYDNTATYSVGDARIYNNKLYVCNTDISTPEEFDSTKWDESNITDYCNDLNDKAIYFQDGETYEISGEVHLFTFSGGRSEKVNIFTPKKIKTGYTVTVAGTIKAIYTNTTSITSDITLSGDCTVRGDNSVVISVSHSTAMSTNLVSVVPNSLLFTFHAPV